jgi:putative thioredoxin
MLDISRQNLETDLIEASMRQPVLLDIWAPWCGPCKTLGPTLERLEQAYAGRFKLAKLNSDAEPEVAGQLSQMFGVRSIPFCVLFKGGQPVDGFVGALPEAEVRAFLDKHVASAAEVSADEDLAQAGTLLAEGDTEGAVEKLQEALAINPANDTARYDCLRALLGAGRLTEARLAYAPVASNPMPDARLAACGHWIAAFERADDARTAQELEAMLVLNKRDFDTRFELAQIHFAAQRFTQAMDELLEIILRDKTWNHELARKTYVAILELMNKAKPAAAGQATPKSALEMTGRMTAGPTDPVLDSYRRKLSMAVF